MSNEYLKSLIDTVSGIEVKSEAEQIAKYELIESCIKYKQVLDKIKEWKKQNLFELNRQYKTFEYWEELFEDLDKILEEIDSETRK